MSEVSAANDRLLDATTPHREGVTTGVDDSDLSAFKAAVTPRDTKDRAALRIWAVFSDASESITVRPCWTTESDTEADDDQVIEWGAPVTLEATGEVDEADEYHSEAVNLPNYGYPRCRLKVTSAHSAGTVDLYAAGVQ